MEFERGMGLNQSHCNPCWPEGAIFSEWIDPEAPCTCWEVVSLWQIHRQVFQHALVFYADQPKQECLKEFYKGDVKLGINRELKKSQKIELDLASLKLKWLEWSRLRFIDFTGLWEGLQKYRGDREKYIFSRAVTKMQHGFRVLATTGRIGRQKALILVSASHPCVSLVVLYSGYSPQMHFQQSTQLINVIKSQ